MKQKNKVKRLKSKQIAYENTIKNDSRFADCMTKPGSVKKP